MLVSCVMPTKNRRGFIPAAIDCWLRQSYPDRELVILDDGEPVEDLIPKDSRIGYHRSEGMTTGSKRNLCNELARGEIIVHFDDDDFSAPERIADQVGRLQASGLPVTGYGTLIFWDAVASQAKQYRSSVAGYVCGTSLAYLRSFWQTHRFPDKQQASDNAFVYPILRRIAAADGSRHIVARIHGCHHTSSKAGISEIVPREMIPEAFWENEELRLLS
jgi:glycosyltransferase involved in cell wall biosynthesis